jgi:hypothetical protein
MQLNILLTITLAAGMFQASSQHFKVGAMTVSGVTVKMNAELSISDSTMVFMSSDQNTKSKIVNRNEFEVYITDGTATDKLTMTPLSGSIKGFKYDYTIVHTRDKRFSQDGELIYFCRRKD